MLGGVNLPEDLLTAHEEGRLVIFTGAGISISSPSNLPDFPGLAKQVAARLQSSEDPTSKEWESQLDTFMGLLDEDDRADVHGLVKIIVTAPDSRPNENHIALARIASTSTARLVTTNYDLHLERSLRQCVNEELEVFRAPAMPLGDNFKGLVYLHGSAETDPERLVVTDRDFSKAYFHSAWAARFLERMFSKYVVLFVGYSHSDVVMRYLGLGLGPHAERYVLTDKPEDDIWDRLRVKVLPYPERQHHILTDCLNEWAALSEMGLLDHRQRIRNIVSSVSPSPGQSLELLTPPAELTYLEDSICRTDRVRFFCDFARDDGWLEWVKKKEPFSRLFDPALPWTDASGRLAVWFAETFAFGAKDVSEKAWRVFAERGSALSATLWNALAAGLNSYPGCRPPHVLRWLWVLLEQERLGCATDYIEYGFTWEGVWDDRELALALLEHLMSPRLVSEGGLRPSAMEVETRGDLHWLDIAWTERFRPALDTMLFEVFAVVERALTRHLALEKQTSNHGLGFSYRRAAIQPNENDKYPHRKPIDVVIDSVRDCVEKLWVADSTFALQVVDRWVGSGHRLLVRLAVHSVGASTTLDVDSKIKFLLKNGLPGQRDAQQEVFFLMETSGVDASPDVINELIGAFAPATDDLSDEYRAFTAYELLERSGVVSERLTELLASIREKHDDFEPMQSPGMTSVITSWVHGTQPMSVEDFAATVLADPAEAVQYVLSFDESVIPSGGKPSRADATVMVRKAVEEQPWVGLSIWSDLHGEPDLEGAVIGAWGHATELDDMNAILDILLDTDLKACNQPLGQFLLQAARPTNGHWDDCPMVDAFVDRVWDACETRETYTPHEEDNWLSTSTNVTVGHLLDFWFNVFHRRWTVARDDWAGLPERDRTFLDRALADRTKRGAHALTQISSRLHYLDEADSTWCRRELLSKRDWARPEAAEPFWWGVLSYGRWNSGLAAEGLIDGLVETGSHLNAFTEDQSRRWAGLLASIAVRCEVPAAATWLGQFTAKANADDRGRWIEAVADELADLDERGRMATWTAWLKEYWVKRTENDPVVLTQAEMNAFACMAPYAPGSDFWSAVELILMTRATFDAHATASRHLSDALLDSQPEAVGRFLTHLMENTDITQPFWGSYELRPWLEKLIALHGDWTDLRNAALRLGIDLP